MTDRPPPKTPLVRSPLLKTLWMALRRGPGRVQFGTDPEHAVVVEGLHEDEVDALELLDGTRQVPDALRTSSGREVLDLLRAHGLVVDATDPVTPAPSVRALLVHDAQALLRTSSPPTQGYAALARRRAAHVLVVGRGTLPGAVAAQLRRSGVGTVAQGPQVADDWEQCACADPQWQEPALVVITGDHALEAEGAEPWRARGIPVLPVVLHGIEAVVGPIVEPGGPCLRCLDLARTDLDPAWPLILGQLTRPVVGSGADVSGETTLVGLASSMAAMVALAVVDGQALPPGRSLEVGLPWPRVRQRRWEVHPRCSCAISDRSGRPADVDPASQARMAG